jgi:hypothetical protein
VNCPEVASGCRADDTSLIAARSLSGRAVTDVIGS